MKEFNANSRIAINTLFLSIRMVIVMIVSLFTTRIILNSLGVDDYGIYTVIFGLVALCAFLNTSLANGIQRYYNFEFGKGDEDGLVKVFNTGVIIQILLVILILILGETFGVWYINNKMLLPLNRLNAANWVFQFSLVYFLLSVLQAPFVASVLAHEKMNFYAVMSVLDAILKLIISFIIAWFDGDRLIMYGFLLMMISVINICAYGMYAKHNFKEIKFRKDYDSGLLKSMLSFSGWNIINSCARIIQNQGLTMLLNFYFGLVVNAARGIASMVESAITGLVFATTTSSRPQIIASYAQNNVDRSINLTLSTSKFIFLLMFIIGLPIFLETEMVVRIWLGSESPYVVSFIRWSILLALCSSCNAPLTGLIHATGKIKWYSIICGGISISILPIVYVVLNHGGIPQLVYFYSIMFAILNQIVSLFIIQKSVGLKISLYIRKVLLPVFYVFLVSSILPIIINLIFDISWSRMLMVCFLSLISTAMCSYYIGLNMSEKNVIKNIVNKLFSK